MSSFVSTIVSDISRDDDEEDDGGIHEDEDDAQLMASRFDRAGRVRSNTSDFAAEARAQPSFGF